MAKEELQNKRAAALQATLELISEQGFEGTPMSQIAQRANVGVGTIYRYFANKDDLINALYLELKARLKQHLLQNYDERMPVREAFRLLLGNVIRYFVENPSEALFVEQYSNSPLITAQTREESLRIVEPGDAVFKRAVEQHLLKDMPVEMLSAIVSGAVNSLVKLYLSGAIQLDEKSINQGADAIWDAIKR